MTHLFSILGHEGPNGTEAKAKERYSPAKETFSKSSSYTSGMLLIMTWQGQTQTEEQRHFSEPEGEQSQRGSIQ